MNEAGPVVASARQVRRVLVISTGLPLIVAATQSPQEAAPAATTRSIPKDIPVRRPVNEFPGGLYAWSMLAAFLLVMLVVLWVFRKRLSASRGVSAGSRAVVSPYKAACLRLGAKHTLYEVHWRDEALLLACTDGGLQLVAKAPLHPESKNIP